MLEISGAKITFLKFMATPPACFGFQYLSKIQASASLEFAILKNLNMSMNLFLCLVIDDLLLSSKLWMLFTPYFRLQYALSTTSEYAWFHYLLQRNQSLDKQY